MRKRAKQFIGILVTCAVLAMATLPVYAKGKNPSSAEKAFPKEKVKLLQEMVRRQPVTDYNVVKGLRSSTSTKSANSYSTQKGVILVTNDKGKDKDGILGHAAIIFSPSIVVESIMQNNTGVTTGPNNWNNKSNCAGVTVKGTSLLQDYGAADWCYRQIGKPYNYNFSDINTRSCFYCSHLVWAAFKDCCGIDLNTTHYFGNAIHPAELVLSSKTSIIYEK